ncbi:hypothetical protein [Secundilactobacillus kimchicus]|uniref:hypothetical protein n=1 Tax=Secundilactobacillus kimchicus TaxID=528209 RepID=UPI0024A82421|nr:hypothetical protein [Secundilactobacillus kimchicus]
MKKILLWIVTTMVAILVLVPLYWSLSPSGAVRNRMLMDFHPVKAVTANPHQIYDWPKNLNKGTIYSYSKKFYYDSQDMSFTVTAMKVKKNGIFYQATPLVDAL